MQMRTGGLDGVERLAKPSEAVISMDLDPQQVREFGKLDRFNGGDLHWALLRVSKKNGRVERPFDVTPIPLFSTAWMPFQHLRQ